MDGAGAAGTIGLRGVENCEGGLVVSMHFYGIYVVFFLDSYFFSDFLRIDVDFAEIYFDFYMD